MPSAVWLARMLLGWCVTIRRKRTFAEDTVHAVLSIAVHNTQAPFNLASAHLALLKVA